MRGKDQQAARDETLRRARDGFERTLAIDPENAAAHFNLSLVYARQGDTVLADRHRQLHEQYRPDDAAIEQAVTRHRSENPAADHAAAAIAIYSLAPGDRYTASNMKQAATCIENRASLRPPGNGQGG